MHLQSHFMKELTNFIWKPHGLDMGFCNIAYIAYRNTDVGLSWSSIFHSLAHDLNIGLSYLAEDWPQDKWRLVDDVQSKRWFDFGKVWEEYV